ncbi:MAG TPA: SIS domain-containing protein, partial [Taishania sp.]|nr:SIS domain-containing protein [Taishania sp.]
NKIVGKNVIIYSVAQDEAIAIRFRQQLNENSKILCSHHVIPEMNHNELVGWAGGTSQHAVIFIKSSNINTQNQKRFNFTSSVIKNYTSNIIEVNAKGSSMLEESLYLINLLDYVSYFLAELRQVDSIEVNVIDGLKKSLK